MDVAIQRLTRKVEPGDDGVLPRRGAEA